MFGSGALFGRWRRLVGPVARGFRGAPGVISDPAREPERVWAKELGIEWVGTLAQVQLALFRLDVAGERVQDPITRDITGAGRSVRQGVEGSVEFPLGPRLRLTATGTVNDANISETLAAPSPVVVLERAGVRSSLHVIPLAPGDPVPGVSRYLAQAGLKAVVSGRLTVGGLVRLNGPFTPIGEPAVETQSYVVADLEGTVALGRSRWLLDWELQNVFNTRYPEVRSSGYLNPGTPRALRISVRWQQ